MLNAAIMTLTMSLPLLVILGLLALAGWRDHRREAVLARQIRLTDAIADELGAIVAPLVAKPLGGPWRVEIQVPVGRPAVVSRIVAIAHDTLTRTGRRPVRAGPHAGGGSRAPARRRGAPRSTAPGRVREGTMLDFVLAGGFVVAIVGVLQTASRRQQPARVAGVAAAGRNGGVRGAGGGGVPRGVPAERGRAAGASPPARILLNVPRTPAVRGAGRLGGSPLLRSRPRPRPRPSGCRGSAGGW